MLTTMPEPAVKQKAIEARILIADDQPDVLRALCMLLKGQGYATETVASPAELLQAVAREEFDLLLMDLNYARDTTSGREGLDLVTQLKTMQRIPPIVVMTGWATVGIAIEALRNGVSDFVEKPWSNTQLLEVLRKQITLGRERRESALRAEQETHTHELIASQLREQEREIAEARAIQEGLVPKEIPQLPGYEITATWQSARVVGGDYFDVLLLKDDMIGLCIADVAGKGMPAALLMSNLQAAVRGLVSASISPEDVCVRLNTLLCRNMASDRFVTFFYAQLDASSRTLRYVCAGHNPPVVMRRDGSHERLEEGGGVLGIFAGQAFESGSVDLRDGDRLVFFTDGVTEVRSAEDEEFGDGRLLEALLANRELSALEIQKRILTAASDFSRGLWHDDATLLVMSVGATSS